jgi:hypothetical protein
VRHARCIETSNSGNIVYFGGSNAYNYEEKGDGLLIAATFDSKMVVIAQTEFEDEKCISRIRRVDTTDHLTKDYLIIAFKSHIAIVEHRIDNFVTLSTVKLNFSVFS